MARNINAVMLTGNLTRDPELRSSGDLSICKFGLAVNENFKKDGEWQERANFFDIVVFGKQAENCERYLSRGRAVAVAGRLRFESWEKDGQKRSRVVVVAEQVQFLNDGRAEGSGESGGGYRMGSDGDAGSGGGYRMETAPAASAADDDIPF